MKIPYQQLKLFRLCVKATPSAIFSLSVHSTISSPVWGNEIQSPWPRISPGASVPPCLVPSIFDDSVLQIHAGRMRRPETVLSFQINSHYFLPMAGSLEPGGLSGPFEPKPFCGSLILWLYFQGVFWGKWNPVTHKSSQFLLACSVPPHVPSAAMALTQGTPS